MRNSRREWPALATSKTRRPGGDGRAHLEFPSQHGRPLDPAGAQVWVLYQAPAGPTPAVNSPDRFPCGVILLAKSIAAEVDSRNDAALSPRPDHAFELFAWVRRPHRSTGLGSRAFPSIFKDMKAGLKEAYRGKLLAVRTRYPKWADEGDQELAMWQSFFALYDFKPLSKTEPDDNGTRWTILEYQLNFVRHKS